VFLHFKVLSKDSGSALNEEEVQPGPMVEIEFWEAKLMNLESIFEQMKCETTKNMASILQITDRYRFQYYLSEI
jgi:dynein heavy chain